MKRILLIHTGGTFGMVPIEPSKTLAPADIQNHILAHVPEITRIADVEFKLAFNIDSANIQISHWQKLAKIIYQNYSLFDGFVIIHGTDAMVYTASALSYMLRGLSKPVILTGSQRPLSQIRSDARSNLINSMELATYNIPEVTIFFGTRLYRGNRTIKISSTHDDAFASPNFPPLAEVGLDISISEGTLQAKDSLIYENKFDSHVFCMQFYPGLPPNYLDCIVESPIQAVVVKALGAGNLAVQENSLIPWIKKMNRSNKIIVMGSQSPYGRVNLDLYESGKMAQDAGGISSQDMTNPATIVKLMFLLGQNRHQTDIIKKKLLEPLSGEITLR